MTPVLFLQLWAMVGIYGVIARRRMIWKEPNQAYRFTLLVLTIPAQLLVSIVGITAQQIIATAKFWKCTMAGEDPGEPKP